MTPIEWAEIFRGIVGVALSVPKYWMEATEHIMDDLDFSDKQKLKGAVPLLRDEAYQWWLTVKEGTQPDRLTWNLFKTIYHSKYVKVSYTDTRRREFLNLTQGDLLVVEYEAEFIILSRYKRGVAVTKYEHGVRFEDGLCDSLRVLIAPQGERDFSASIEKAKIAGEVKRSERPNREKRNAKRDSEPTNVGLRPKKKARTDGPVRVGPTVAVPVGVVMCQLCNRRHPSKCWRATEACLRCGSTEHRVKDCPLRGNQVQVRLLRLHSRREGYISHLGAEDRLGVVMVWVEVREHQAEHHVRLDCAEKRVVLRTEEDNEIVVIGKRWNYLSNVISALVAEKLVRKRCEVFMAYISVSNFVDSLVKDIRTVRGFPYVFPEELPRLPLSRELEFGIELIPGVALVSIAPYRMASKELAELKA
ncbi:uncharacterized protein [Gossypium hirsutum]|uniref:CCHC-type domain-containing protein n=1 Tax=Gossypium hirsutum TaxID=3635 RepID=A0A1U8N798_GOSHI|nr:uncharacterized protein LOC107944356 [Gossypium hirsutum]